MYMYIWKHLRKELFAPFAAKDLDEIIMWMTHLSSGHMVGKHLSLEYPGIQFTVEEESDGNLPFMGTLVERRGTMATIAVYQNQLISTDTIHTTIHVNMSCIRIFTCVAGLYIMFILSVFLASVVSVALPAEGGPQTEMYWFSIYLVLQYKFINITMMICPGK